MIHVRIRPRLTRRQLALIVHGESKLASVENGRSSSNRRLQERAPVNRNFTRLCDIAIRKRKRVSRYNRNTLPSDFLKRFYRGKKHAQERKQVHVRILLSLIRSKVFVHWRNARARDILRQHAGSRFARLRSGMRAPSLASLNRPRGEFSRNSRAEIARERVVTH